MLMKMTIKIITIITFPEALSLSERDPGGETRVTVAAILARYCIHHAEACLPREELWERRLVAHPGNGILGWRRQPSLLPALLVCLDAEDSQRRIFKAISYAVVRFTVLVNSNYMKRLSFAPPSPPPEQSDFLAHLPALFPRIILLDRTFSPFFPSS